MRYKVIVHFCGKGGFANATHTYDAHNLTTSSCIMPILSDKHISDAHEDIH